MNPRVLGGQVAGCVCACVGTQLSHPWDPRRMEVAFSGTASRPQPSGRRFTVVPGT